MMSNIRRLYNWTLRLAARPDAAKYLGAVAFIESSIFPIPPDVMLIPMCIAQREKSFHYAGLCTICSVLGGILGYAIGFTLYESVGRSIVEFYGMTDSFASLQIKYQEYGGWILLAKGMTPFPYKILTILSGVMHMGLPIFITASIAARAMRFFMVAALLWKFGAPIQTFIEKYLGWLTLAFLILLIGGFVALKYIA